ncbi:hypothetical protein SLEP1_g37306 [Rubroshorea leprosula]|uniref:Cation/H+ exchanger domain-containing protein n=1 Tax=Rubroshorea leprosula TaxID=152421 RepID=A0AAV5KU84_9ROSI|nr:hypothetical protein SLEP1_g37306 [Rubroshorea leprosula]
MAGNITEEAFRFNGSCWRFIPVYSEGIWNLKPGEYMFGHALLRLHIQLALMIILTSSMHFFLGRLHLPRLVSELMTGIILGPTVLGEYFPSLSQALFSSQSLRLLSTLVRFGFLFSLFLIGVKMDISLLKKSGAIPWVIGCASMLTPWVVITLFDGGQSFEDWTVVYKALISTTRFPVVACLLMDLKIINTELGCIALSSSLICEIADVTGLLLSNSARAEGNASLHVPLGSFIFALTFVLFVVVIVRPIMYWIIKQTPEMKPVKESYTIFIMVAVMFMAVLTDIVGLHFVFTSIVFGFAIPSWSPLASTLVERFDAMVSGMLIPLLSIYCGLKTNLWSLSKGLVLSIIPQAVSGLVVKIIVTMAIATCFKMPMKDTAALGLMLCAKGIVELGMVVDLSDDHQMNTTAAFTMVILTIFTISAIIPFLVRKLHPSQRYTSYHKRNILQCPKNVELCMLVCSFKQDDAIAAVKLLEISNPTKESPLSTYCLYLKKLTGGATPMLINHQLYKKNSSSEHWQPIFSIFNYFKLQNLGLANLQVFTAISPAALMHEVICRLAFEKPISLITVPFHRRWNFKGDLIVDSSALRNININVLDKAPCSVGILVDRCTLSGSSTLFTKLSIYCIAVLYLGGEDDREALAYAKRIAGCATVQVTVIRFIPEDHSSSEWDDVLDNEFLKDIKHGNGGYANITYTEKTVRDGSEMALIIQSMGDDYDLVMVGRRHKSSMLTSGLEEWVELPELGLIGDLLASPEIKSAYSVLIVQNQITEKK